MNFADFSSRVNDKRRHLLLDVSPSKEDQRIVQIVYLIYIENPYLHLNEDRMLKIGTCTLDRFDDRLTEHARNFSTSFSVMEIVIVPNASVEKDFHRSMEKEYPSLVLPLEIVTGNFKEVYVYDSVVIERFYNYFKSPLPSSFGKTSTT